MGSLAGQRTQCLQCPSVSDKDREGIVTNQRMGMNYSIFVAVRIFVVKHYRIKIFSHSELEIIILKSSRLMIIFFKQELISSSK